ncbi:MAG: hypothetical protein PF447_08985, partial [Spirochaetaceae bacterium]|nr:hypothetical protein [Spirochaetaceae bacterium]
MSSDEKKSENAIDKEINNEIEFCINLLEKLSGDPHLYAAVNEEKKIALLIAAGKLSRPTRHEDRMRRGAQKKVNRQKVVEQERKARAATGIRKARETDFFSAPKQITTDLNHAGGDPTHLNSPRNCYVCKAEFTELHFFYDTMCPKCADFNYQKRFQTADLRGQVALITGSRLKIGYHATLMMLRAGATVIATTRFPVDSAIRYAKEDDYLQWRDRLQIYGLDVRHTPSVEIFCSY